LWPDGGTCAWTSDRELAQPCSLVTILHFTPLPQSPPRAKATPIEPFIVSILHLIGHRAILDALDPVCRLPMTGNRLVRMMDGSLHIQPLICIHLFSRALTPGPRIGIAVATKGQHRLQLYYFSTSWENRKSHVVAPDTACQDWPWPGTSPLHDGSVTFFSYTHPCPSQLSQLAA
jgi:hypothetical protein